METNQIVSHKIRKKRKLPKSIRPEEFKKLISTMPSYDKRGKVAFLLAYGSGLRISEVTSLEKKNVTDKIFISDSKYGVDRVVPIPKGWKAWMIDYIPIERTDRSLQIKFKRYAKKANLNPEYTFHSLRHGFATRLLESGAPINQVQLLLGHSNISTTSVYTKASPVDALKNYEELF